jgi:hypothetical protein
MEDARMLLRITATLAFASASAVAPGCYGTGRIDIYTCDDPCGNGQPGYTCDDPCGECRGQCIPLPPLDFEGPMIVHIGAEQDAPECPAHAPVNAYEGFGDLRDETYYCPPCECSEPACVLPEGVTASPETCMQGAGGVTTSIEAPTGWQGECTSPTTANNLGSVIIAPVTVLPCEPIVEVVPDWEFYSLWNTFARACKGQVDNGRCADPGLFCMPTAEPPPPGFRQCIAYIKDADPKCPNTYPDKFTFYAGAHDTRGCTECECQQQGQADCSALVSLHQTETCSSVFHSGLVGTQGELCGDVMPGLQLRSIEASWSVNEPGTCTPSGGVPVGEVMPEGPKVFCCQPPP